MILMKGFFTCASFGLWLWSHYRPISCIFLSWFRHRSGRRDCRWLVLNRTTLNRWLSHNWLKIVFVKVLISIIVLENVRLKNCQGSQTLILKYFILLISRILRAIKLKGDRSFLFIKFISGLLSIYNRLAIFFITWKPWNWRMGSSLPVTLLKKTFKGIPSDFRSLKFSYYLLNFLIFLSLRLLSFWEISYFLILIKSPL